jgi:hypothetical protein
MAAPWVAGAQARIHGEIHGQQTVNVLNFGTNAAILDGPALDTLLLQLAEALLDCVITTLLPAVSIDWRAVSCDAKRIYPVVSDPIIATADGGQVGEKSATSVSFAASLLSLRTGGGGRKGRGRLFLPPTGEAEMLQSQIDSGTMLELTAFAACLAGKFLGASPTTPWRLGVLSRITAGPTNAAFDSGFRVCTQLSPVQDVAVMRSRRKGHGN